MRSLQTSSRRTMAEARPHVLLADDDSDIRFALAEVLVEQGFDVTCVSDGKHLVSCLRRWAEESRLPDILVTDHHMPGCSSLEVLGMMKEEGWNVPVLVMTGFGGEVRERARELGAYWVFEKPFEPTDLSKAVRYTLRRLRGLPESGTNDRG